jgi:hypothetical protein
MGREKSAKSEVAGTRTMSRAAAGSITQSIIVQSNDTALTLCDSHRHSIPRLAIPRGICRSSLHTSGRDSLLPELMRHTLRRILHATL